MHFRLFALIIYTVTMFAKLLTTPAHSMLDFFLSGTQSCLNKLTNSVRLGLSKQTNSAADAHVHASRSALLATKSLN
jgi:hypothetical protein